MNDLAAKLTPKAVLTAVKNLPTHIDDMYAIAMQRIVSMDEDRKAIVLNFLMWVIHACRPLSTREIEYATTIRVRTEAVAGDDFDYATVTPCSSEEIEALARENPVDEDEIVRIADLLSMCAGLATIDEFGKVSLVHYTVKRYFSNTSEKWFRNSGDTIAQACLNFLVYHLTSIEIHEARDNNTDSVNVLDSIPFLVYACGHWSDHLKKCQNQHTYSLALGFLESRPNDYFLMFAQLHKVIGLPRLESGNSFH